MTLQDQSFLDVPAKSLKKILWKTIHLKSCLSSVPLRIKNGLHTVLRVKPFPHSPAESRLKTGSIWACTSPVPSPHPSRKNHCSTGAGPHMCRQPLGHGVLSVNQKPPDWKKKKKRNRTRDGQAAIPSSLFSFIHACSRRVLYVSRVLMALGDATDSGISFGTFYAASEECSILFFLQSCRSALGQCVDSLWGPA